MKAVYLDHAATTPMRDEVIEAMMPYFKEKFGNASSVYSFGREARKALDEARQATAGLSTRISTRSSSPAAARKPTTWPSKGPPGVPAQG